MKINNLEQFENEVGKETARKIFTEYFMMMMARNKIIEDVEKILQEKNSTIAEIRKIFESEN